MALAVISSMTESTLVDSSWEEKNFPFTITGDGDRSEEEDIRLVSGANEKLLLRQEACTRGEARECGAGPLLPLPGKSAPWTKGMPDAGAGCGEALLMGHS